MRARGFVIGAALAAGGMLLIPGVAAAVGRAGRPLMRATMKTGATAYDEFRRAGAEAYEHMEDIAAEIRAEMEASREAEDAAPGGERAAEGAPGEGSGEDAARSAAARPAGDATG